MAYKQRFFSNLRITAYVHGNLTEKVSCIVWFLSVDSNFHAVSFSLCTNQSSFWFLMPFTRSRKIRYGFAFQFGVAGMGMHSEWSSRTMKQLCNVQGVQRESKRFETTAERKFLICYPSIHRCWHCLFVAYRLGNEIHCSGKVVSSSCSDSTKLSWIWEILTFLNLVGSHTWPGKWTRLNCAHYCRSLSQERSYSKKSECDRIRCDVESAKRMECKSDASPANRVGHFFFSRSSFWT